LTKATPFPSFNLGRSFAICGSFPLRRFRCCHPFRHEPGIVTTVNAEIRGPKNN
jgi:hypothetical protein